MVSEELRTGLYVSVPIYFGVLALATWWAHRHMKHLNNAAAATTNNSNDVTSSGRSQHLKSHYLGGGAFGPILTAGTVFASLFSGYTIIGIPTDAYYVGFLSFLWVPATVYIVAGYALTGIRLRKASEVRNHQTPVDFITDRFQSQYLRYSIVMIQILSSFIYLAAQVNALKGTFNSMFGVDDPDTNWPVIVIMFLILAFEWFGGLASVALTDSVQGLVMLLFFILLPIVIKKNFGGWSELDPYTYPRPDFYQTPTAYQQVRYWQFCLLFSSFFTLPHLLQRIYAARNLSSLKTGWTILAISPWVAMFVGVFIGTVGVQILDDAGIEDPASPFTAILEQVMLVGGFAKGVGVLAFTASLAAIMSTTDSLIIAVSHLLTVEVAEAWRPAATAKQTVWRSRFASLITAALALVVGILWKDGISQLAQINFPCMMQAVPTFLIGLYASESLSMHPWSLATAALLSIVYVFAIFFSYLNKHPEPLPLDSGVTGVVLNLVLAILFETLYRVFLRKSSSEQEDSFSDNRRKLMHPDRPRWDIPNLDRYGPESLTPSLLNQHMTGVLEHARNGWYVFLIFLSVTVVTPMAAGSQPPLDEETGEFLSPPAVVRGIPWWFLKEILLCIIAYIILIVSILQMPSAYPVDDKTTNGGGSALKSSSGTTRLIDDENMAERRNFGHQETLLSSMREVTEDDRDENDSNQSENLAPAAVTASAPLDVPPVSLSDADCYRRKMPAC